MVILTNEEKLSSVALLKKNTAVYLTRVRDVRPCLMLKASPMPDEERWAIIHRSCSGRSKSNRSRFVVELQPNRSCCNHRKSASPTGVGREGALEVFVVACCWLLIASRTQTMAKRCVLGPKVDPKAVA